MSRLHVGRQHQVQQYVQRVASSVQYTPPRGSVQTVQALKRLTRPLGQASDYLSHEDLWEVR